MLTAIYFDEKIKRKKLLAFLCLRMSVAEYQQYQGATAEEDIEYEEDGRVEN